MLIAQIILIAAAAGLALVLYRVGRILASAGEVMSEYEDLLEQHRNSARAQFSAHPPDTPDPSET